MLRRSGIALIVAAVITLTGCGESGKIYNKDYVRAVAVAGYDGNAVVFSFYDEDASPFAAMGDDLADVVNQAELGVGHSLFTGHIEMVVLGQCDYAETLTFLLNEWKIPPSCIVADGEGLAAYALKVLDSQQLADSIRVAVEKGEIPECDVVTVLSGLLTNGSAEVPAIGEDGLDGTNVLNGG
jgi:hypothetical protein